MPKASSDVSVSDQGIRRITVPYQPELIVTFNLAALAANIVVLYLVRNKLKTNCKILKIVFIYSKICPRAYD